MLSPDKLQFVFPNVEVLAMLSKSMLADLEKIRADWKPSTVRMAPILMAL